jgi:hypothetical protein
MIEKISPTTTPDFNEGERYTLEDKDFLLITALNNLATEIRKLRVNK